ncbi:hypothetical protein PF005_g18197 [Phytophthora fragariae]|uniref:Uncharacterized protein n=1 Tax=Phytophthora fragariae TaxID=53985 RepID=A0A6A3WYV9_9STRA|nr:hypothetical protein PF007_g18128 [Phytophthora fragariae]KAE9193131.1 hypothetical protein PF005_g18197 [Phytophthora fragariae]KAE9208633.1 hypothetical protein PF002_g19342 [Phytophthora fragariae]
MLFNGKKWTYIQDSSSNTGQYSGQIQFNLSTISSQAEFVNWSEAVIELPVKLQILNGATAAAASSAAASYDQLIPKAGAWQFLDSVQVVVDGVTVQTNQIDENAYCTFKALTEWSQDDLLNYGSTSTFALDKYEPPIPGMPQSLDNVNLTSFINPSAGEFGLASSFANSGARERAMMATVDQQSTKLAYEIVGNQAANLQAVARPQVGVAPAGAVSPGAPFYVAHYIATIRLAGISDYFKKCPMQKNVSGYIYLNYNSSSTQFTTSAAGIVSPTQIGTPSYNMQFGNTCPVLYNFSSANTSSNGTITGLAVPSGTILTITADVNGTSTSGVPLTPSQTFSRLLVPTYSPNPSADHALTQKKSFRYFERITNKFVVGSNSSFTVTLTNGIANPKKLIMVPGITNATTGGGTGAADSINPFRSPLSTVPATCSPFVSLKNLQVTLGNIHCFNNPVSFGYDLFVQEMSESGIDGGLDDTTNKGLLSQQLWESLYRFVAIDVGRRLPSEDGASKSIVVSGTNNTNYPITVYYHVLRDAVATVDTSMGTVSQGATQKAYDQFYNQRARSDFVQRRKLRAIIAQDSADESLTDKLAQLYMGAVGKAPEYGYDKVLKKVQMAKPEVVKGPTIEIPKAPASATPASTRRPRRSSMEIFLEDQATNKFIHDTRQELWERKHKKTIIPSDARDKAEADVESYVYDYQKRQRAKKASNRRELTADEIEAVKKQVVDQVMQTADTSAQAEDAKKRR